MNQTIKSFLTSDEIGALTQTAHELVLERACEQLVKAGIDPNKFWHDYVDLETGVPAKRLHLPKKECLLVIGNEWFSEKAKSSVMAVWGIFDLQDDIAEIQQKFLLSPTLVELHRISQTISVDINSHDDLREAFATCSADIICALDAGKIHFEIEENRAMLIGLLTVVVDHVMKGNLKTAFNMVTIN